MRIEVKSVVELHSSDLLKAQLTLHPLGFSKQHPDRTVRSIYFDSHGLDCLNANFSGTSSRFKLRLRWYGDTFIPPRGQLETKKKENLLSWKETLPIETLPRLESSSWSEFIDGLTGPLSGKWRLMLQQHPRPILINSYLREYWVSQDQRIRVTLDRRQEFFDQLQSTRINTTRKWSIDDVMVVETKFLPEDLKVAQGLLSTLPCRSSKNSKYVTAFRTMLS